MLISQFYDVRVFLQTIVYWGWGLAPVNQAKCGVFVWMKTNILCARTREVVRIRRIKHEIEMTKQTIAFFIFFLSPAMSVGLVIFIYIQILWSALKLKLNTQIKSARLTQSTDGHFFNSYCVLCCSLFCFVWTLECQWVECYSNNYSFSWQKRW